MTTKWIDACGSATGGTQFLSSISGAVSAQTTIHDDQPYAYQYNTSSPAATAKATDSPPTLSGIGNTLAAAGSRITKRFYCSALPSANNSMIPILAQGSGQDVFSVAVGSDGKVRLYTGNAAITLLKTGATVLSAATWYRISIAWAITTTTSWSANVYIDGTLEFTATNADGTLSGAAPVVLLASNGSTSGTNNSMYISSVFVDDASDQSDTGNVRCTNKFPTTTTTNNFDSTVGTGVVNERPVNTANGKFHGATTDVDQDYQIEAASAGDVDLTGATIVDSIGWIWANVASLTGTPAAKIIVNGARVASAWDSTSASTTVGQLKVAIVGSASYPQNANAKNIGTSSSVIAADTYLFDCGAVIAYIPAAAPTTKSPPPFQRPWRRLQRRVIA